MVVAVEQETVVTLLLHDDIKILIFTTINMPRKRLKSDMNAKK